MKKLLLALSLWLGLAASAYAQNPQCPTRPLGDDTNACASTAFVQNALTNAFLLPDGQIWIGDGSGVAQPRTPSGDWTITNTGVNTVAKVNGVSYPAGPSTNTIPVVTGANTVTYQTAPVAAGGTGATTFTSNLPLIGNGTGAIAQGTRSGNTTSFATTTGTLTSGNCVQWDASGNLVEAAGPCGVTNAGTTGQVAYYASNGSVVSGSSAIVISGGIANLTTPIIDTTATWEYGSTTVGTQEVADPTTTTPVNSFVTRWQASAASATTSIHVIPGAGALTPNTITELVAGTTAAQAFGGDYGRWSLTNQGSALNYVSGLFGEYGGATATGAMGPFIIQVGIENPASTFTTYEFVRFQTATGGSESTNVGASLFGASQPNPGTQQNRIVLIKPNIGGAGQYDSDSILWEGKANDGTERATWWRQYVDVTSNAGASTFTTQSNLNGAGWVSRHTVTDAGIVGAATFNASSGFQVGGVALAASNLSNGTTGTGAVVLASSPTVTTPAVTTNATITNNLAANTTGDGLILQNTTAATSGNQRYAPALHFISQGWETGVGSSQTLDWRLENRAVQGAANATSKLVFSAQVAGGGYHDMAAFIDSGSTHSFGIGTISPNYLYQLNGGTGQHSLMQITGDGTGSAASDGAYFGQVTGSTEFRIYNLENDAILFATNNGGATFRMGPTGHFLFGGTGSITPSVSSCGTSPAVVSGSTDTAGAVTAGTGSPTGCTITFANAYASAPFCMVQSQTQLAAFSYTISTTAITVTQTGTSSNRITWQCMGAG